MLKHIPSQVLMIGNRATAGALKKSLLSQPIQGSVGFVAQSGATKIAFLNQMVREGIGLSNLIYYHERKNKIWDESEILEELAEDSKTKVIIFCVESINEGRRFVFTARKISRRKPIIIFKSGKSKVTANAILSHTGSMAGSDEICNAAFKQSGILRAQTLREALDFAKALSQQPSAKGRRVGIVTNGGGIGIIAADSCINLGLEVPALPESIRKILERKVALISEITNPLDLRFLATAEIYREALETIIAFQGIDVVILMVVPAPALDVERFVDVVLKLQRKNKKPIVVSASGSDNFIRQLSGLENAGIPVYIMPESAASGAAALVYYGQVCS